MALGGFLLSTYDWLPHADTQGDIETALNGIITALAAISGWSTKTALTSFAGATSDRAWYWNMLHTSGAEMVWTWSTDPSADAFIHADNDADGATRTTSQFAWGSIFVMYKPAAATAIGAGNPSSAAWLPSGSPDFWVIGGIGVSTLISVINSGGSHKFHFLARGDEIIVLLAVDSHVSTEIDSVFMGSTNMFTELVNVTDTNAQGSIHYPFGVTVDQADRRYQSFLASGTRVNLNNITWTTEWLVNLVNDRAPWAWSKIFPHVSNADLDTFGIVAGLGIKGTANPEFIRAVSTSIGEKAQLESGNLIHLRSGMCVGYDSTNGTLP